MGVTNWVPSSALVTLAVLFISALSMRAGFYAVESAWFYAVESAWFYAVESAWFYAVGSVLTTFRSQQHWAFPFLHFYLYRDSPLT